jgi:hypothetical protein
MSLIVLSLKAVTTWISSHEELDAQRVTGTVYDKLHWVDAALFETIRKSGPLSWWTWLTKV